MNSLVATIRIDLASFLLSRYRYGMSLLILMRHAKSDWSQGTSDFDRPLNKRGRRAAKRMGRYLTDKQIRPDLVLCSPSRRTRDTLARLLPHLGGLREIQFVPSLYEHMAGEYLGIIRAFGADAESLMVIGHNSATHETAVGLAAGSPRPDFANLATAFPTAAMATFSTDAIWSEIQPDNVFLESYVLPRHLQEEDEAEAPH